MWKLLIIFILTMPCVLFSQADEYKVEKENLTKKESLFYDYNKSKIQSIGAYYTDKQGPTTMKHGKWTYFDREGKIEEERNYYKDLLHGKVILFYPNSKPKQEGYFYLNQPDSVYREWNETGRLAVEGNYSYGKPNGIWTYYYLDGRKKSEEIARDSVNLMESFWMPDSNHTQTVVNGNGEMMTFYTTGTLKEWYHYKDGLKDGPFEEWSIYGYKTLSGSFVNGEKDGEWFFAYYSGKTDKISNYKNGKLDGPYKNFYEDGTLYAEGHYADGKKSGKWTWFTSAGTRDMQGSFLEDKQNGDWTYWYSSGEVSYTAHYTSGVKTGVWNYYYKNGKKFKEGPFQNDEKEGIWRTWYEDGTLLMEGNYTGGKESGEWKNYWDNGKLKNVSSFYNGELNGAWYSYSLKGGLTLEGKYKNGLKTGMWKEYFESGQPREFKTYKIIKKKSTVNRTGKKKKISLVSELNGKFQAYSDKDGKLMEEGNYKNGLKVGTWTAYHAGGRLKAVVSNYKNGKLDGEMSTFDKRGKIISSVQYKNGLKHGSFKTYDKKGKITSEKRFSEGMLIIEGQDNKPGYFSPGK
ncbi:MAG: hypothetical protein M9916_09175 [Crocinitomicaceae bacterium]|nr:hypothetical protein [Crocinitomicaceae bacterium]